MDLTFTQPALLAGLETAGAAALDALTFGVVGMNSDGIVIDYNAAESELSGLQADTVVGRHFFTQVAPCTNNYLIAHRFQTETAIDDIIDYVFTVRMQPTKVQLRLLKQTGYAKMFLGVERR